MIRYILQKMWKNNWLMLCLIVGNILLIGIAATTPLYNQATIQRIFQQNLQQSQWEQNRHPAILELHYTFNALIPEHIIPHYHQTRNVTVPGLADYFALPVIQTYEIHALNNWHMIPLVRREYIVRTRSITILGMDNFEYVNIIQGRLPSNTLAEGNVIETIASQAAMMNHSLLMDELMPIQHISFENPEDALFVRIVGVFENSEDSELFWTTIHFSPLNTMFVSNELVRSRFVENYQNIYRISAHWFKLLDYSSMVARNTDGYIQALNDLSLHFRGMAAWDFNENFSGTLEVHIRQTAPLTITLLVLQVPLFVLMAFYIYMVSRQSLQLERNEISILKSRGAGRMQIMGIYAVQGLFIVAVSAPFGVALGVFFARMMGASSGFLYLVQRAALQVEINEYILAYAAAAMVFSFLTMYLPVIGFSKIGIVEYKQGKRDAIQNKAIWQRFYLDVLFLGISLYGFFTFNNRRDLMAGAMRDAASVDPLLYISSSLFIIGAGLLALRVFPYFIQVIYLAGRRFWPAHVYASLLRVVRSVGEEQFVMIFLVVTLAVGIFSAHSARTINTNNDHRIMYLAGADLIFREFWPNNVPGTMVGFEDMPDIADFMPAQVIYEEPDFERFTNFSEVESITRVQRGSAALHRAGNLQNISSVELMGVESNTFGNTIWFRDDFLPIHVNHFLNALAENPNGVLISYNMRDLYGFTLGEMVGVVHQRAGGNFTAMLEVVGFVERWPGFAPVTMTQIPGGGFRMDNNYLVVANLGHLQTLWGTLPYEVWMSTNTPTNDFFYVFAEENNLRIVEFTDSKGAVTLSRQDPILQGTNGILTMSFIVTLLICFFGFLIYWVLSIRQRVLQFGIFRAMGLSMRRLFGMLITEQVLITFTAILIGVIVGEFSAFFFVPLIQLSYTAADQVIPLLVVVDTRDYINLLAFVGAMIIICIIILSIYISGIKIAQALKLGED